ncbi:hypothetical protein PanWU01x14_176450 [Parasponia andersonii]|uniref:Uncharacterized protein n=1 Tax=Parasponia andersonii TaxID=3476 RepID=A0A2P5C7T3_PARAD|nr:hypothetical protein PanWU01x14_176450 [Parasponia andersonii]
MSKAVKNTNGMKATTKAMLGRMEGRRTILSREGDETERRALFHFIVVLGKRGDQNPLPCLVGGRRFDCTIITLLLECEIFSKNLSILKGTEN